MVNMASGKIKHIITTGFLNKHKLRIIRHGWCISSTGLFWYLAKSGIVYNFNSQNKNNLKRSQYNFPGDTIRSIFEDSKKQVWVLRQDGLSRFSAASNKLVHFSIPYAMHFNDNLDLAMISPMCMKEKMVN